MPAQGLQLLLPDGLTASAAADALAAELAIVSQRSTTIERTFWDTFDGRVRHAGLALVSAGGRLALADATSLAERAGETHERGASRLLTTDLRAGALRDALAPIVEMRAVMPVVRVKSRALPLNVLDEIGKIVVRLRVEEPTAIGVDGDDAAIALRARLHVDGVLGYDRELAELRTLVEQRLALGEQPAPVQDDAVRAVGGTVGGTSAKLKLTLDPQERADAAAVKILRRLAEVIELNTPGTLANVDSEFLHDLRVAVRRTRALQRELRGVFAPEPLRAFRDGFKELQRSTGPTRDLDVQLLEFDDLVAALPADSNRDVEPLRRLLQDHLHAERRRMVRALRAKPARALLANWSAFLDLLEASDEEPRPDAARPVGDVAGARIAKVYRRMVKMGGAIDEDTPAEALHELRKQGKELRYLLEFFQSLYPAAVVKPMVASLKVLQDVLGRFQDREVQAGLLRSLGDEVATLDGGAAALMAMGLLVRRLGEEQALARTQFAESFAAFAAKSQRRLVGQTFGMMRVVALYNIKGGVGKTSAAVNLAWLAAQSGARTLLWDLDPQGAASYLLRIKPKVKGGARKLVAGKSDPRSALKGTDHELLDLLPADFSYRNMDLELGEVKRPTRGLARVLSPIAADYEYVFLDCPPQISLASESVFGAADVLLVPVIPSPLSLRTLDQLQSFIAAEVGTPPLILAFFSMADGRKRLHRELIEEMTATHDGVLRASIPAASDVERMALHRRVLAQTAPRGRAAALAYAALWEELRSKL